MNTRLAFLLTAGLTLCTPLAFAQNTGKSVEQAADIVDGRVVSTNASTLVIATDTGVQRTFKTNEKTLMPITALAAGDRVSVKFRVLDATHAEALDVTVLDPDSQALLTPLLDAMPGGSGRAVVPAPTMTAAFALLGGLALAGAAGLSSVSRLLQ